MSIGIFYASAKGHTKSACEYLAGKLGAQLVEVKDATAQDFAKFDVIIVAAPSYGDGELSADWTEKLPLLKAGSKGKKAAIVAVGNQANHPQTLFSGAVDFLPYLKDAQIFGASDADGYKFNHSAFFINGKFAGLALDVKGDENYAKRIDKWVEENKPTILNLF